MEGWTGMKGFLHDASPIISAFGGILLMYGAAHDSFYHFIGICMIIIAIRCNER